MRTGSGFLNFPQATQHLAAMALSQPTRAQRFIQKAESVLYTKLGAFDLHLSRWSAVNGPRIAFTHGADIPDVYQSTSDAAAPLVDS